MRHTEGNLRALLDERASGDRGGAPDIEAIVRRGHRLRRGRYLASAVLAGVAVASVAGVTGLMANGTAAPVAVGPMSSAKITTPAPDLRLPPTMDVVVKTTIRDAKIRWVPLIEQRRSTTAGKAAMTFRPSSVDTGFTLLCSDPRAWVLTRYERTGEAPSGGISRCGDHMSWDFNERRVSRDWLKKPQSLKLWVFPADAPINPTDLVDGEVLKVCALGKAGEAQRCDPTISGDFRDVGLADRLAAQFGERPLSWAVGIYDAPKGEKHPPSEPNVPFPSEEPLVPDPPFTDRPDVAPPSEEGPTDLPPWEEDPDVAPPSEDGPTDLPSWGEEPADLPGE
ncbi:hypothetical protein [Spongiactinospora sp. TRM90649]|uniref:hypothetical protein n=1 Tax=Spongiactinospora sp. TRM90649 TaxID=3031114 RepID=UPI0023F7FE3F|nr:hypothetical protein [Spongiactinospora sp. TRM90649]MDF5751894.1 hypothetical protein [Spongiactinospora sp. TRM90649]